MPLGSGDRITLEVAVQELDPASITYPPVALHSTRRGSDLYLEIPIAALTSDRDGDGLTDIVEEHLLLNPDKADSDGDGLDDSHDPARNERRTLATKKGELTSILQHIVHLLEGAIIQTAARGPDVACILERMRGEELGINQALV